MGAPYILFCAGEDSGDILGEALVSSAVQQGYKVVGSGGSRMQSAGLEPLVDFNLLPVSGFGDVLPKYFQLRKACGRLKIALKSSDCKALVCIDYPGFNMRLCALAKKLRKPVLYVAPPQIWAWKRSRGKKLRDVNLAVLFDFEKQVYEGIGCNAWRMQHPFLKTCAANSEIADSPSEHFRNDSTKELLLLPGSRRSQAFRNLPLLLSSAILWKKQNPCGRVKILAARQGLQNDLKKATITFFTDKLPDWISVEVSPQNSETRRSLFQTASVALSAPGSATLELALAGTPFVVAMVPDALTYLIGSALIHTRLFSLPNILLKRKEVEEFILPPWNWRKSFPLIADTLETRTRERANQISDELQKKLAGGEPAMELIQKLVNV